MSTDSAIKQEYDALCKIFTVSPLDIEITHHFRKLNELCQSVMATMRQIPLKSTPSAQGKNYIIFISEDGKKSRPINIDLYNAGISLDRNGDSKIDVLFYNLEHQTISLQSPQDITSALYVIAMNYCCCSDILSTVKGNAGAYFEKFIGHLYARHLNINPQKKLNAVELDEQAIVLPTDFIFDLGSNKPKLHVPVKTSTRERAVEVWAQQKILDGAFGVGRFACLLTCLGETNLGKNMTIGITCVPNQWMNYQLFISQIFRAYYLDVPDKYMELNYKFPKIYVKEFGEFFHESDNLFI